MAGERYSGQNVNKELKKAFNLPQYEHIKLYIDELQRKPNKNTNEML